MLTVSVQVDANHATQPMQLEPEPDDDATDAELHTGLDPAPVGP